MWILREDDGEITGLTNLAQGMDQYWNSVLKVMNHLVSQKTTIL